MTPEMIENMTEGRARALAIDILIDNGMDEWRAIDKVENMIWFDVKAFLLDRCMDDE